MSYNDENGGGSGGGGGRENPNNDGEQVSFEKVREFWNKSI
jgi:hypothetical protein